MKTASKKATSASSASKSTKGGKKAPAAKAAKAPAEYGPAYVAPDKKIRTPHDLLIIPTDPERKNPCNPLKNRHSVYALFLGKKNITVGEFKEKGGIMFDLFVAIKMGVAVLHEPLGGLPGKEADAKAPAAAKKSGGAKKSSGEPAPFIADLSDGE
jgi:hypothetical protein